MPKSGFFFLTGLVRHNMQRVASSMNNKVLLLHMHLQTKKRRFSVQLLGVLTRGGGRQLLNQGNFLGTTGHCR